VVVVVVDSSGSCLACLEKIFVILLSHCQLGESRVDLDVSSSVPERRGCVQERGGGQGINQKVSDGEVSPLFG